MAMSVTYTNFAGQIVSENRGGVQRSYLADTLGNTVALMDSSGSITDTWEYSPFGQVVSRTGTNPTPFQFVGTLGYYTGILGQIYIRARHYLSAFARWLTADPLWPDQLAYGYVGNKPIQFSDPSGLDGESLPLPPPGITGAQWAALIAALEALGLSLTSIAYILAALIAIVLLIGISCHKWQERRYVVCPTKNDPGVLLKACKGGELCLVTILKREGWAICAAIALFLNIICFPWTGSHGESLQSNVNAYLNCQKLYFRNCANRCLPGFPFGL